MLLVLSSVFLYPELVLLVLSPVLLYPELVLLVLSSVLERLCYLHGCWDLLDQADCGYLHCQLGHLIFSRFPEGSLHFLFEEIFCL